MEAPVPLTYPYKRFDDQQCFVDIFLSETASTKPLPLLLYFHGGGLTVGSRKSWFPTWMCKRALRNGMAFISADYRLLPPATGFDVLSDILDLFSFIKVDLKDRVRRDCGVVLDTDTIVVAGTSAGGLCAYLAAIYAIPKPKAVLSMYSMGGDFLHPQYFSVKTEPFFVGREILNAEDFKEFLYPFPLSLTSTADSPLAYHPPTSATPGWPANPRMPLCRLYLQLGVFLDYYLGAYEPSISEKLRKAVSSVSERKDIEDAALNIIAPAQLALFPQFNLRRGFPPVFLVHGEIDSAVKKAESENMLRLLKENGVRSELHIIPGQEHSFDYQAGAEEKFSDLFDRAFAFISDCLGDRKLE